MNKVDKIIDALRLGFKRCPASEMGHFEEALAIAHELKNLTPTAWAYDGKLHFFDPTDWASLPVQPLYALEVLK